MKIKEIYGLHEVTVIRSEKYDIWYNKLLNKEENEITENDVYTMLTQKVLEDLAIKKALTFIEADPLAGEMWDGQTLEQLSTLSKEKLYPYKTDLERLLIVVEASIDDSLWDFTFEKEDFLDCLNSFRVAVDRLSER